MIRCVASIGTYRKICIFCLHRIGMAGWILQLRRFECYLSKMLREIGELSHKYEYIYIYKQVFIYLELVHGISCCRGKLRSCWCANSGICRRSIHPLRQPANCTKPPPPHIAFGGSSGHLLCRIAARVVPGTRKGYRIWGEPVRNDVEGNELELDMRIDT